MASNNNSGATSQQQQQHFQQPNSQHHCKECGLFFDSAKSLEVHLQYHKENLLNKWATQATQSTPGSSSSSSDETNNNNSTKGNNNKREFNSHPNNTIAAAADSSDAMLKTSSASNKSPDSFTSRTTPETSTSFGHPPTPQSYNSVPSPYQSAEASTFSPGYQNYPPVKSERASPLNHYPGYPTNQQQHMYPTDNQYFSMDQHAHQQQQLGYPQDYPVHKIPTQSAGFRYHPYHHPSPYERSPHVTSSSPAYPSQNPQPTPSPSPKQCDKCGFVCDSATQLIDHLNHAHPPTPAPHMNHPFQQNQQQQQHFQFNNLDKPDIKTEDEPQTEILDLDSHKVHQVFQSPEEEESMKRHNGELSTLGGHNPHSVTAMLNPWSNTSPQQKIYSPTGSDHRMFLAGAEQKIFPNAAPQDNKVYAGGAMPEAKMFQQEQKLFQPHQIHSPDFMTNGVTTTTQDGNVQGMGVSSMGSPAQMGPGYRPFDHIPSQPNPPVISSTQLPNSVPNNNPPAAQGKGANWKSNEARRPKTYNCSACNKWFTSSGHLKRHYNTTLHKNAVKSSGQPDPASLPISAHHHPGRDSVANRANDSSNHSPDPHDDSRVDEANAYERTQMPGLLQQPPSGPYDRQPPPNLGGPQPPSLHSPMTQTGSSSLSNSLTNLSAGSPPNGEAGPSATHQDHSRGLLSISTPNTPQQVTPLSPMAAASMSTGTSQQHSPAAFTLLNQPPPPPPPHLMVGIQQQQQHSSEDHNININTNHHNTHHPQQQQQQQVVFQNMSPPSSMPTSYPNGLAPHVTPVTAISNLQPGSTSLTITGESATAAAAAAMYSADLLQPYGQPQQYFSTNSLAADQQPLPSFAQFQPHRYGLLLTAAGYQHQANVGGLGPVTDSHHLLQHHHHQHHHQQQHPQHHQLQQVAFSPAGSPYLTDSQHSFSPAPGVDSQSLMFQDTDGDYEITVLENSETVLPDETSQTLSYNSPPPGHLHYNNNNNTNGDIHLMSDDQPPLKVIKLSPASPIRDELKRDYENGSPRITSTGSPLAGKTAPPGVHKCFDCDKIFNKACYLTQHNKTFHCGDKPFKCGRCGKRFPSDDSYQEHLAKHAGDKPYKCELCPKQFNHKTDLRRHMCLHTGQKPYACDHCGKGFIRKDHMLKHADTHARKTAANNKQHAAAS